VVSGKSPITLPGGLGAYAYNTAKILNSSGYTVYVIGFSHKEETIVEDFANIIHVKTPFNKLAGLGMFFMISSFVKKMKEIVENEKASEIIVYSAALWGTAGIKLKKELSKKKINVRTIVGYFTTYQHEYKGHLNGALWQDYGIKPYLLILGIYYFAKLFYKPIEHRMLKKTDVVAIHYESTRKILLEEIKGLDPNRVVKFPYYIDIYTRESDVDFTSDCLTDPNVPTVSVICRQDPRKGINTFLKAVKILKERNISFNCVIAGSGIFLKHHKKLANKLGLMNEIKFLGFVKSVNNVLNYTDIYVLPSIEEGSGAISLLEAMKKGVAIVTTLCDGIPEDFIQNKTGVLVEMNDQNAMADALERLIKDASFRQQLANNVKEDYRNRFTFEKMKVGMNQLLSNLSTNPL